MTIEKNIPIPRKARAKESLTAEVRKLLCKMDKGDSIALPDKKHLNAFTNALKHCPTLDTKTFKSFTYGTGHRVWRVN